MNRTAHLRLLVLPLAALALLVSACSDSNDTTANTTTTEADASQLEGPLLGTFTIDTAACAGESVTAGSYFRMLQPGGTIAAGPYIENSDSSCGDKTYSALGAGSDGGLVTGTHQPAPDPAFDATGNALADAIFQPVKFFAVAFGGATDPQEPAPSIVATGGALSGDLSAFTAYYGGSSFNQGSPKPDGSGDAPVGTIDPQTGRFTLEWTSKISGGSFNDFTGIWHLEGTFTAN